MSLVVSPGPIPDDGDKIVPNNEIRTAVTNTSITNFGADAFVGAQVQFLTSSTQPPATDDRGRSTLWFRRGEGVLYAWDTRPPMTGTSDVTTPENWLAISNRREIAVLYNAALANTNGTDIVDQKVLAGDLMHLLPNRNDGRLKAFQCGSHQRMALRFCTLAEARNPYPPFAFAATSGSHANFLPVVMLGYFGGARVASGATLPGHGGVVRYSPHRFLRSRALPWSRTEAYVAHIVSSSATIATDGQTAMVFIPQCSSNLLA